MELFNIVDARNYVEGLQGYKLSNTHFKIGGKFHADTFIHAKVLLHNSFYTSRLALNVAGELYPLLEGKDKVTLVGYERYSELFLGLLTHFLHARYKKMTITSCIMVDKGEGFDIYGSQERFLDYVVVLPIVSTATTTKKMIAFYQTEQKRRLKLEKPTQPLHVFHILHLRPDAHKNTKIANCTTLVSLDLNWSKPHKCDQCFTEGKYKALLEADRSNLNPIIIFGKPTVKTVHRLTPLTQGSTENVPRDERSFVGEQFTDVKFDDSLIYLQDDNNKGLRTYSHKTDVFIEKNKVAIENWLGMVKRRLNLSSSDKVVILSPCQNNETNLSFVNLVNEKVFSSSATIVYHEADREYPENFKLMNYDFLKQEYLQQENPQLKVYYVDDDLVSGRSFFTIYDLFRYSTDYSDKVPMSGAIFLMNKSSASVNQRIIRAAKSVHSFVAINIPQYYSVGLSSPFDLEIQRYGSFAEKTLFYNQERYFMGKQKRLLSPDRDEVLTEDKKKLHQQMFYATHTLFELFAKDKESSAWEFHELCKRCNQMDKQIEDPYAVIRVLSRATFTMYLPLKDSVFGWVSSYLKELEENIQGWTTFDGKSVVKKKEENVKVKKKQIEKEDPSALILFEETEEGKDIAAEDLDRTLQPADLDHLAVLIRRSALIGNYRIIQKEFFGLLAKIFDTTIVSDEVLDRFEKSLTNHYCELILNNYACIPKLIENLKPTVFNTARGQGFKTKILDQTSVSVEGLYNQMCAFGFQDELQEKISQEKDLMKSIEVLMQPWLEKEDLSNHVEVADIAMGVKSKTISSFEKYVYLKSLFHLDQDRKGSHHEDMKATMDDVFSKCTELLGKQNGIGAFFAVFDIAGDLRLVYDRNESGAPILRYKFRQDNFQQYLKCLDPDVSGLVLKCIDSKGCTDSEKGFLSLIGEQYKYLALLHIGSVEEYKTYGIIGFYAKKCFYRDIGRRYLMLLRRDFKNYIAAHHKNDEFVALLLAENKKRFAYLSGHGRETIQKLASNYNKEFGDVVSTMERVQALFLDIDSTRKIDSELFDKFFIPNDLTRDTLEALLARLEQMAYKIYKGGDYVEWNDDLPDTYIKVCPLQKNDKFQGKFSIDLLEFICFELTLNAKKYRFFKTDEFDDVYHGFSDFQSNKFELKFDPQKDEWVIRVSGTGPRVWESTKESINEKGLIKENDDISGLDLIIKLIKVYDNNNSVKIDSVQFDGPVFLNTVSVHLRYRLIP